MAKPWMNSDDLISAVTRKIAFPISQNTFSQDDILAFVNEEMMISQVPSVLQFHEEYYVTYELTTLLPNTNRYHIPHRAIGMKLRDMFWSDDIPIPGQPFGNLFELTKILPDDKAYFQRNAGSNQQIHKFFLENDDIVLMPPIADQVTGSLVAFFYLRPNQLVTTDRAAIITSFQKNITVTNTNISVGDLITINKINFTVVASSPGPNEFVIGGSDALTAINFVAALNNYGLLGTASSIGNVVTLNYSNINYVFLTTNIVNGFVIQSQVQLVTSGIPANIANGSIVDILQTEGGHKTIEYDITLGSSAISGNVITFNWTDLSEVSSTVVNLGPANLLSSIIVGDYICSQYECIIPYLPSDLHTGLAERSSARILAAIGDTEGLTNANARIQEIEKRQGNLIGNRDEGSPKKIISRLSLLHFGSMGSRRKL